MYHIFNKTCIASSLLFALAGCSMSGGNVPSKAKTFATQGCIGGGVIGAIAMATVGDSTKVTQGAAVGCIVGAYIGYRVAKRTDKYISAQQAIEAEIARNQKNTEGVNTNNQRLTQQIGKYKKLINKVQHAQAKDSAKKSDLKLIKTHLNETISKSTADLNALNQELALTKKQYSKHKVAVKPKKKQNWDQQITALEKEKSILSEHVSSLTALNKSI